MGRNVIPWRSVAETLPKGRGACPVRTVWTGLLGKVVLAVFGQNRKVPGRPDPMSTAIGSGPDGPELRITLFWSRADAAIATFLQNWPRPIALLIELRAAADGRDDLEVGMGPTDC